MEVESNSRGYVYIAIGEMFRHEAEQSCRSLKRFTSYPVVLITDDESYKSVYFDDVILANDLGRSFEVKITGMMRSPFQRTVFLDTDTFVCASIDSIFEFLDYFDFAMTLDMNGHSISFWRQYQPDYHLKLKDTLHEFNTGVVGFVRSKEVNEFFDTWLQTHRELGMYADMPTFREAFLKRPVRIGVLPHEYNFTGIKSMVTAYTTVRIIHDRLGEKWNNLRPHMADFVYMDKLAKRINRQTCKRLIIPYVGIIPFSWSPFNVKRKIKASLGIKARKKRDSFFVRIEQKAE
ncbi:MAG: hypothetical protein JNN04_01060 [Cyclobacteriaceae bacterium]|nr:hypothetical protein [Cyclobacteriaceae bacterium]